MHSLAAAAKLLDQCRTAAAAKPLLDALGFRSGLIPLEADHAEMLGLPAGILLPLVARGIGALRAMVFEIEAPTELRRELARVCGRLGARAPDLLWLVVAVDRARAELAVATFDGSWVPPRIAALVVRCGQVVDSDAEAICALVAARSESDLATHCRWLEVLGRESVSRRFFRALERMVGRLAASLEPPLAADEAGELALLYVSRLLFLSFLETKGWLDRDHGFLGNRYADCMVSGGRYHQRVLLPLFFGTLNTHPRKRARRAREFGRIPFLNGGLFARSPLEGRASRSMFPDEVLGDLFAELLARYRFTAREDTTAWSEAAIDPEMLGKAFESLMSSRQRKTSGAFYTPQSLVARVCSAALSHALASPSCPQPVVAAAFAGEIPGAARRSELLRAVDAFRVLDPACGSGAFLVHVLEELSALRLRIGDMRSLHQIRRRILATSIFGVDINPTAVWLCELRLWLSMAIEDPESDPLRVIPLPNLDRNIRVGDSLAGHPFRETPAQPTGRRITTIRARYSRATGPRKRSLARTLDWIERECAQALLRKRTAQLTRERRELLAAVRSRDLFGERPSPSAELSARLKDLRREMRDTMAETRRLAAGAALPFSFAAGFADVTARGGFDLLLGNPPWVRTHNLDRRSRALLRRSFTVYRHSAWMAGADAAAAGRGFGSQVDVAALFIERSVELLRSEGIAALLVPAKLWRSLAGGGVREFLLHSTRLLELQDLSGAAQVFDAAVYPSLLVARRTAAHDSARECVHAVVELRSETRAWEMSTVDLPLDDSPGSPWLLIPPEARSAFDRITFAGVPLAQTTMGRPLLGVKTGCNEAFIVPSAGREYLIEDQLLRPLIRGDRVTRWTIAPDDSRIIWTHDRVGCPLRSLPPAASRWLGRWRRDLERRSDCRGKSRWWMLFRTESADASLPRVVWADIGRAPRAALLEAGDPSVPINSCYVVRCPSREDASALTALLNSRMAAAWLSVIAEPARGGYRRYLGWTMSIFPLPRDWLRARRLLAPLTERAICGFEPDDEELISAVLSAYGLTASGVAPLLKWTV